MDDFGSWWYLIAAVIYFITRGKKKKDQTQGKASGRPGTENRPSPSAQPKSFEELLQEITGERQVLQEKEEEIFEEDVPDRKVERQIDFRQEGRNRRFADDESRKVYEESIKMAEGADISFEPDENYKEPRLFKDPTAEKENEYTFADEIRDGLSSEEARKAIIYSEILNRKY